MISVTLTAEPDPLPLPRREDYATIQAYELAFHITRAQRQDGRLNREESAAQFTVIERHVMAWAAQRQN